VKLQTNGFCSGARSATSGFFRERAEGLEEDLLVVSVVSLPLQELLNGV